MEFVMVNECFYEWYLLAVSKNMHPAGRQLSEKAKEIAVRLRRLSSKLQMVGLIKGRNVSISKKELWLVSLDVLVV